MNFLRPIVMAFCVVIAAPSIAQKPTQDTTLAVAQKTVQATKDTSAASTSTEFTAHEQVRATTERIMKIIIEAQGYVEKDPDRFYREVEQVLGDVVDFDSFARGVMGEYASAKRYKTLKTEEQKSQFRARMERFSQVFRDGLVQTYAMGLLAFDGNKIEILPPTTEAEGNRRSVTVVQHIYGEAEKPYVVHYKMRRNKTGLWKLRNVTIEAINLGKVYRSQFYSAVKQYNGDIDQVIDNWTVDPTQAQAAQAEAG